jgi:ribosomal protein S5
MSAQPSHLLQLHGAAQHDVPAVLAAERRGRCCCFTTIEQVATAIRGAIILAKMSVIPVRRGYWGNKIGKVHTVPTKVTGKCGSVTIRLIPAPRGAGALLSS